MFGIKKSSEKTPAEKPQDLSEVSDDTSLQSSVDVVQDAESVVSETQLEEAPAPVVEAPSTSSAASRFFKQAPAPILKPSIISEGFDLQGDIKSSGGLHVEGRVDGRIDVDNLTIGAKGAVRGIVKCAALNIKGTFDGEASCNALSLSGSAVVNGDISYVSLTMATGTVLTGRLKKV